MTQLNLSNFSLGLLNRSSGCFNGVSIDSNCVARSICHQLDSYYITGGLAIIAIYVIGSWLEWWFLNYGYKGFDWRNVGDLDFRLLIFRLKLPLNLGKFDNRLYWHDFTRDKLGKLALGFVVVVVYLNWR